MEFSRIENLGGWINEFKYQFIKFNEMINFIFLYLIEWNGNLELYVLVISFVY